MKANRLVFTLLLLSSAAVFQLAAQKAEPDGKQLKDIRAKAEAGDPDSQVQLGLRYDNGEGLAKDPVEAVKWYRKAAEQNYAEAQSSLGDCYDIGRGVANDYAEAYKWLLLAAGQGDGNAKKTIAILEKKMTPDQIAEGQKRARDFKPR
jgi:uncharacterized protein